MEVKVAPPVGPLQGKADKTVDVVDVGGLVLMGGDEEVLGQGELAVAQDGAGNGEKLPGGAFLFIGNVAF